MVGMTASNSMRIPAAAAVSYILPIAHESAEDVSELASYLGAVANAGVEVLVVDGSRSSVFHHHRRMLPGSVTHLAPEPGLRTPVGKVGNVLTGLARARHNRVVIADEDVRYGPDEMAPVVAWLDRYAVVRPQNYFQPMPWHATWDSARSLVNRSFGGDWPGTMAISREALMGTGGYAGDAIFENLEMVRTITGAGGREKVAFDAYVRRLPPTTRHFWSQRVRQAYDEFARPARMTVFLGILPLLAALARGRAWGGIAGGAALTIGIAEAGRRRAGGRRFFPAAASLLAPVWLLERGVCAWIALAVRLLGGVPYRGRRIRRAATPARRLRVHMPGAGVEHR
jgi:hypothetical protein